MQGTTMDTGVSLAKTTRPTFVSVLRRGRLLEALHRGLGRSLAWVSGPPGAGKTTLVSSFLEGASIDYLWYQLDAGDADVATFFYFLDRAARRRFGGDIGLPAYSGGRIPGLAGFSRRYFRELYARLPHPFALVLDNYQEVSSTSALHEIVSIASAETPKGSGVIVLSRAEPPPAMARLRASQTMELIGWGELRLTEEEIGELARVRGESLEPARLTQLHERTRGWAAGLVLMLEHAKLKGTAAASPEGETPQVVFDYLAGEIFETFDEPVQALLCSVACLPEMTVDMASELSHQDDAGRLLLNLVHNDYFVVEKVADGDTVYEFHPLLRQFLLKQLRSRLEEAEHARLLARGAELLLRRNRTDEAVALLLEARRWADVARIVGQRGAELLHHGRGETLARWLEAVPASVRERDPWLEYWSATCRVFDAPRQARRHYERAYEAFAQSPRPDPDGRLSSCCGIVEALLTELDDLSLLDGWVAKLEGELAGPKDSLSEETEARAVCTLFVALALRQPEHPELDGWLERAYAIARAHASPFFAARVEPLAAVMVALRGDFLRSAEMLEAMEEGPGREPLSPTGQLTRAVAQGTVHWLRGDYRRSEEAATAGLVITQEHATSAWSGALRALRIAACLGVGGGEAAAEDWDNLLAGDFPTRRLNNALQHYLRGWCSALAGDTLESYQQLQAAARAARDVGLPLVAGICQLGLAQALSECGDQDAGAMAIGSLRESPLVEELPVLRQAVQFGAANVATAAGDQAVAVAAVKEAFELGRRLGLSAPIWWNKRAMARVCTLALETGIEADYARTLIRVHAIAPETPMVEAWPWPFRVRTLGKFHLLKNDAPQRLSGKGEGRPVEMLKVLIAFGGKDVRTEQVAETLWPHVDGDYAYRSFTSTMHRLRRLLGVDDALVVQDARVSLNPRYCWLDTWALEGVLADIDDTFRGPGVGAGEGRLRGLEDRLLGLYRGAFLEDESDRPCYIAFREHLRVRVLRGMSRIARHWEGRREWDRAIDVYRRGIEADRVAEALYRELMLCCEKCGRRTEALEVFELCRTTLWALVQSTPSPESTAVYERLRSGG